MSTPPPVPPEVQVTPVSHGGVPAAPFDLMEILKEGWTRLLAQFVPLLIVMLIFAASYLPEYVLQRTNHGLLGFLYSVAVEWPMQIGLALAFLKSARGQTPEPGDAFAGFQRYVQSVLVMAIYALAVGIGLILLIVPGVILALRLWPAIFLVADGADAIPAIESAWRLTRGQAGTLVLLALASVAILFAGLLALVVGVIPAGMLLEQTWAIYHRRLTTGA